MDWKSLTKIEAQDITRNWNAMDPDTFDNLVRSWPSEITRDLNEDYITLRNEVSAAFTDADARSSQVEYSARKDYFYDLFAALKLYKILESYGFSVRMASNDQVWFYLCLKVFPDIVHRRYTGAFKKDKDGTVIACNVNEDRFWRTRRRIYLKVLWWYIFLSLQTDTVGEFDEEKTFKVLAANTTDEIVQLVERSGTMGYRVDVYRQLMKFYSENRGRYDSARFRKVMVLNTARARVIEPALMTGGVECYIKELFDYFD